MDNRAPDSTPRRSPDWAGDYFERGYAQRWELHPPSAAVRHDAGNLWTLLRLAPGSRVADIGCGHGRYALALAELGAEVIGIDSSAALLERARSLTSDPGDHPRWIRGDMRRFPLQAASVHAGVLLDAFGFFDSEEENQEVLHEAARVLVPEGRLALKVVNGSHVLEAFRESDREEREGTVVTVFRTLTHGPPRMTERVSIRGTRGDGDYERRQRLYGAAELRDLFEQAGFADIAMFATPAAATLHPTASPAIWIVGGRRRAGTQLAVGQSVRSATSGSTRVAR